MRVDPRDLPATRIAEALGYTPHYTREVLAGVYQPSLQFLLAFSEAFGMDLQEAYDFLKECWRNKRCVDCLWCSDDHICSNPDSPYLDHKVWGCYDRPCWKPRTRYRRWVPSVKGDIKQKHHRTTRMPRRIEDIKLKKRKYTLRHRRTTAQK